MVYIVGTASPDGMIWGTHTHVVIGIGRRRVTYLRGSTVVGGRRLPMRNDASVNAPLCLWRFVVTNSNYVKTSDSTSHRKKYCRYIEVGTLNVTPL